MPTATSTRLIGRVVRVIERGYDGYFFAETDDKKRYFGHQNDVRDTELPSVGAFIRFDPLPQTAKNKCDRAANIEIVGKPG
jgi:hypothetical protein